MRALLVATSFKMWVNCKDSGLAEVDGYLKGHLQGVTKWVGESADSMMQDPLKLLKQDWTEPFSLSEDEWRIPKGELSRQLYDSLVLDFNRFRKK
jgi:hypothetical protein